MSQIFFKDVILFISVTGTKNLEQNLYILTEGYANVSQLRETLLQTKFYSLQSTVYTQNDRPIKD